MPIRTKNLADVDEIPEEIVSRLRGHEPLLRRLEHSEQFFSHEGLDEIVRELDALCKSDGIVGIHYTRSNRGRLLTEGLLPRSGQTRRKEFLDSHGHLFDEPALERLAAGWSSHFDAEQNRARDNRIWFNATRVALCSGTADRLLSHYGGEVVHVPFSGDKEIEEILRSIGDPLILECALSAESVRTFSQYPWGRIWLSSYHCSVNPDALQWDVDLYTEQAVPPEAILKIEFVEKRFR